MKIHEKLLTHYLSCPSPVDKEGYLYKKVGVCCAAWKISVMPMCLVSIFKLLEGYN